MNYWKYTYDSDDYSQKDTISCGNAICHLRWQKNRNSPPPLDFFCLKNTYFPYKGKSLISNYPSKQNNGTSTPSGIKITFSFKDYMDFF